MHRHMSHEEEQKNFFCWSQVVLAWGLFEGFFWPEEGRRPSEGQKNPSNSPKAKTSLAKAKQVFFVIPKDEKCRALTLKYHFFNYRTIFPLQKVSFLAPKIPIGRKSFLSLSTTLWHNFLDEMKMHDLCSNFEGTFPVMAVHGCHQTI